MEEELYFNIPNKTIPTNYFLLQISNNIGTWTNVLCKYGNCILCNNTIVRDEFHYLCIHKIINYYVNQVNTL